jgi:hypothetical protein
MYVHITLTTNALSLHLAIALCIKFIKLADILNFITSILHVVEDGDCIKMANVTSTFRFCIYRGTHICVQLCITKANPSLDVISFSALLLVLPLTR